MKRLVPILVSLVILAVMVAYLATQSEMIEALGAVSLGQIGLLLALALGGLLAQAQQFRAALKVSDTRIGMFEATGLTAVNTMANYYVPARGGTVVRAVYMNTVHAMSVSAYVILTVATVALGLIVATVGGLVSIVLLSVSGSEIGRDVFLPFVGVIGFVILVGVVMLVVARSTKLFSRWTWLANAIAQLVDAARLWRHEPAAALRLLAWTVAVLVLQATRLFVAFRAVGASVEPLEMVLIGSLVSMSFVISLTPGNLGIKEGVTALAGVLVGVEPNVALLASLVDRGAALAVTFGVGIASVAPLVRRATNATQADA